MASRKKLKHILVVEDNARHLGWYNRQWAALGSEHSYKLSITDVESFQEVEDFVQKVKASKGKMKLDCAVVDMQIWQYNRASRTGGQRASIHWGIQALKEIQTILELGRIVIITAFKANVKPHLSDPEVGRITDRAHYDKVFQDRVIDCFNWRAR